MYMLHRIHTTWFQGHTSFEDIVTHTKKYIFLHMHCIVTEEKRFLNIPSHVSLVGLYLEHTYTYDARCYENVVKHM